MASINSNKHTITASLSKKLDIIAPVRHTDLLGLDYEHSGHTGFASTQQLNEQIERNNNKFTQIAGQFNTINENIALINEQIERNDEQVAEQFNTVGENIVIINNQINQANEQINHTTEQINHANEQIETLSKIKGLPDVTNEDTGKFLRVDNEGKWVVESVPMAEEQEGF